MLNVAEAGTMAIDTITHDDVIQEEPEEDFDDDEFLDDFEYMEEKIIIPSPKVSIDENDIPIIVNNKVSPGWVFGETPG